MGREEEMARAIEVAERLDKIDEWHDSDSEVPLHEYLGMTWDEYKAWVESGE